MLTFYGRANIPGLAPDFAGVCVDRDRHHAAFPAQYDDYGSGGVDAVADAAGDGAVEAGGEAAWGDVFGDCDCCVGGWGEEVF